LRFRADLLEQEMPSKDDFASELSRQFSDAAARGAPSVDINSGELHRIVGGYPGTDHRMPICCDVMYAEYRTGDAVLSRPPRGKGASVTIRYALPR
jgi:5-methylcytosine-specific restriction protein A